MGAPEARGRGPGPARGGGMKRNSRGAHRTPREKERETHDD